jgi:hypothetical protein
VVNAFCSSDARNKQCQNFRGNLLHFIRFPVYVSIIKIRAVDVAHPRTRAIEMCADNELAVSNVQKIVCVWLCTELCEAEDSGLLGCYTCDGVNSSFVRVYLSGPMVGECLFL